MGDIESADKKPRDFKTRKRTVIDYITLFVSVPGLGLLFAVYKDYRDFATHTRDAENKRHAETYAACKQLVIEERERAKEVEAEIKNDVRDLRSDVLGGWRRRR